MRSNVDEYTVTDVLHGSYTGVVDDLVLRRGDGVPAYNLAVVVDDAAQGIDQVVRGDDLLSSSPRQAYLGSLLGYPEPEYAHVPLVLNAEGKRLAKRDGAVTLAEIGVPTALSRIAGSLGFTAPTVDGMLAEFDPVRLPREPWVFDQPRSDVGVLCARECAIRYARRGASRMKPPSGRRRGRMDRWSPVETSSHEASRVPGGSISSRRWIRSTSTCVPVTTARTWCCRPGQGRR